MRVFLKKPVIIGTLVALVVFFSLAELGLAETLNRTDLAPFPWQITPTPAVDRLAEPVLPPNPNQADYGAQAYWLHCMPCHGDHGQGLTVEFRVLYPPEDRNCWTSGCHGARPYEDGFTIPERVPRIIGPGALTKFETAQNLFAFVHAAMPYQAPSSLDDETYWTIIAFLLRENGIDNLDINSDLSPENANSLFLHEEKSNPDEIPLLTEEKDDERTELPIPANPAFLYDSYSILVVFFLVLGILSVIIYIQYVRIRKP